MIQLHQGVGEKVNRGGLFLVNDSLYDVFYAMQILLSDRMPASHGLDKRKVVPLICENNEWSVLTSILMRRFQKGILIDMVSLWITIRGFSYASAIVEQYKHIIAGVLQ